MVYKLVSKAQFARMCNVSATAVTKASKNGLKKCMVGKRIDSSHKLARDYLAKKTVPIPEVVATGLDSRYEEAVDTCKKSDKWTITHIQSSMNMSFERAQTIHAVMAANGVIPPKLLKIKPVKRTPKHKKTALTKTVKIPEDEPVDVFVSPERPQNYTRGAQLLKERKKSEPEGNLLVDVPKNIEDFIHMPLGEIIAKFGTDARFVDWLKATKSIEDINEKRLKNAVTEGKLVSREVIKTGIIDPIDAVFTKLLTDGAKTIARRAGAMSGAGKTVEEIEKFVKDQLSSFIRPVKAKTARSLRNA